jgi:hypothetical protein
MREERRLRVSENRVLRRIFGPKTDEVTGSRAICIMRSLMICTLHSILFGWSNKKNEMSGACNMYEGEDMFIQGLGGGLREGDHSEDLGVDGGIILRWISRK